MKKMLILAAVGLCTLTACKKETVDNTDAISFPDSIAVEGVAQNPEGIEYDENGHRFFLSSLNAGPILKVNLDGTNEAFTSGDPFPLSTAGLEVDADRNRLLAAGFNGQELLDNDSTTRGTAFLRSYNLTTGAMELNVNLSFLLPNANAYFANDVAVDQDGNVYITDWYADAVYKVDTAGTASLFWTDNTGLAGSPNGIDVHPDGYLLVSLVRVNQMGQYADYGLVKIPLNDATAATTVSISNTNFRGFDGMLLSPEGKLIGVSNDGTNPGGNLLLELSSTDNWSSAQLLNQKAITASTTVALTEENENYVIQQDFADAAATSWLIEKISF